MAFLKFEPWKEENEKTTHYIGILWGEVVKKPRVDKNRKKRYTEVLVQYAKSPKRFMACRHWSGYKDDFGEKALDATSRALEGLRLHDTVFILGRYDTTPFVNKDGVEKVGFHFRVEMIIPQDTVAGLAELMGSISVQNLMKLDAKYQDRMYAVEEKDDEDDEEDYEDYGEYNITF